MYQYPGVLYLRPVFSLLLPEINGPRPKKIYFPSRCSDQTTGLNPAESDPHTPIIVKCRRVA